MPFVEWSFCSTVGTTVALKRKSETYCCPRRGQGVNGLRSFRSLELNAKSIQKQLRYDGGGGLGTTSKMNLRCKVAGNIAQPDDNLAGKLQRSCFKKM